LVAALPRRVGFGKKKRAQSQNLRLIKKTPNRPRRINMPKARRMGDRERRWHDNRHPKGGGYCLEPNHFHVSWKDENALVLCLTTYSYPKSLQLFGNMF
jgi:hypothetical protein